MKYFALLLVFASVISAQVPLSVLPPPPPEVELPFPLGEKLTYSIHWGVIEVGTSVATTGWIYHEGHWVIQIKFRTKSNGVIEKIYPVDDTVIVWVDPATKRPLLFSLDLNEGGNKRKSLTTFYWDRMEAVYYKEHDDKEDEIKTVELEKGSRDLVSFMYFLRETPFENNKKYSFHVLSDYKLYNLKVTTDGYDSIQLNTYGKVKSLRLNPKATFEGIFVRKGRMKLWLSADKRQLLTKMELDTPFANVRLRLEKVEGPGAKEWKEQK